MAYAIEIEYTTGDSFGSHREKEQVGCIWEDKEQARLALSYIKEHYEIYKRLNDRWSSNFITQKQAKELVKTKPWVNDEIEYWEYRLKVPCGETTQQISSFWCGYFETLHAAQIATVSGHEDLDSFSFE